MTISAVVPDIAFAGSGGAGTSGPFSLVKSGTPLIFFSNSEVVVLRYDSVTDTTPTLLVEGVDYTLTGGPSAGSITLTSPQTGLLTAERLYVTTLSALAQSLDLVNGGNFSSSNLERRLDVIFQILQQQAREIKSTIRFAMFDTDEIPKTTPLGAVIDKIPYVTGTASAPTVAYLDALVLNDLSELSDEALADIALVAADLAGADTIGIVAASIDEVEDVAADIASVVSVAGALNDGSLFDARYVDTYAAARLLTGLTVSTLVYIRGRSSAADGGEGWFRVAGSGTDDDGVVLTMADLQALRRVFNEENGFALDWYGILPGAVDVAVFNTVCAGFSSIQTRTMLARAGTYTFASRPAAFARQIRFVGQGTSITTFRRDYSEGGGDEVAFLEFQAALSANSCIQDIQLQAGSGTSGGTMLKFSTPAATVNSWSNLERVVISPASGNYAWAWVVDGVANAGSGSQGHRDLRSVDCFFFTGSVGSCLYRNATNGAHVNMWASGAVKITGGGTSLENTQDFRISGLNTLGTLTLENCNRCYVDGAANAVVIEATCTNSLVVVTDRGSGVTNNSTTTRVITQNGFYPVIPVDEGGSGAATPRGAAANFSVPHVLAMSAAALSLTGTTSETTLATVTVPAGAMGANGMLRITTFWTYTNNANNKKPQIKFDGTTLRNPTLTTTGSWENILHVKNANNAAVQVLPNTIQNQVFIPLAGAASAAAVNSALAKDITFTGQLANSGDTLTLQYYLVELIYAA